MKNLIWILAAIMLAGCGDNEEGQDMGLHGDPPGYRGHLQTSVA